MRCDHPFSVADVGKAKEIRQDRLAAAVVVSAVRVESVATTSSQDIDDGLPQIVAAEKPSKGAMCFARPPGIFGQSLRGKACSNRGGRLDWLLVKARAGRAYIVEALSAHRPEQACRRFLASGEPSEAPQAGSDIDAGAGRATDR